MLKRFLLHVLTQGCLPKALCPLCTCSVHHALHPPCARNALGSDTTKTLAKHWGWVENVPSNPQQPALARHTTSRLPKKGWQTRTVPKAFRKWMWVTYSKNYHVGKSYSILWGRSLRSSPMTEWAQWAGQDAYRKEEMFRVHPLLRPCLIPHPEGSSLQSGIRGTFLYPEFPYCITRQFIPCCVTIFVIIAHQQRCCSTAPTRDTALAAAWSSKLGDVCSLFCQGEW